MEDKKTNTSQYVVSKDKLLEYGVHFGKRTQLWDPKMKNYILKSKNGVHVINTEHTQKALTRAYKIAYAVSKKGGNVLFVGTTPQSKETVLENATRSNSFYINERWLGGTLTNFKTIKNSVSRLKELERLEKSDFDGYTKKEGIVLKKELEKKNKLLIGIKYMRKMPSLIVITGAYFEPTAIKEANRLNIPIIAIVNTNTNPDPISIPIPSNDQSSKPVSLITTIIADAIIDAKGGKKLAALMPDDDVTVLGVKEKTPEDYDREKSYNNRGPHRPSSDRLRRDDRIEKGEYKNSRPNNDYKKVDKITTEKPETKKEEVKGE